MLQSLLGDLLLKSEVVIYIHAFIHWRPFIFRAWVFAQRWIISLFQLSLTKHLLLEEVILELVCSLNLLIQLNCLIQIALLISQLALGSIRIKVMRVCSDRNCSLHHKWLYIATILSDQRPALLVLSWMLRLLWRQSFVVARQTAVVDFSSMIAWVAQSTHCVLLRLLILLKMGQSTIGASTLLRFLLRTSILIKLDGSSSTYQRSTR